MMNRLKNARKMKGLSLREAAKGLGISHEGLRKFENGKIKIDSSLLVKFAKFYNVKPDYIVISNGRPVVELGKLHFHRISKYV